MVKDERDTGEVTQYDYEEEFITNIFEIAAFF